MIEKILQSDDPEQIKPFFAFNKTDSHEAVLFKFGLWARKYFPKYFTSKDAPFHKQIDMYNLRTYRGEITSFVDVAFRGASKTARTKLFMAFCIANDMDHLRRYIKILSADGNNSKQISTDVYNMLVSPQIKAIWPEIFEKTSAKREETMLSFTTATGVKVLADTVGTEQRGAIQEDARPDWILFEDFETRKTLRSAKETKAIWDNMEEARTGLSKDGSCIYNCNYISEMGNVHQLITRPSSKKIVMIIPILQPNGEPAWDRYTKADIEQMRKDDDDFEGERLCKPSASKDILFDRDSLEKQVKAVPIKEIAGFKIFKNYNPSHRIGSGHDVAGGVGLDSSTSVFIDFDVIPAQVVATFKNNTIKPDTFGDEIARETRIFGGCIAGIEKNNHGHATIARARQLEVELFRTQAKDTKLEQGSTPEYGWHTNALTKPKMIFALAKAVEDGLITLNDPALIAEAMAYSRNDLIDSEADPRLTTRHFDLLIACCIAWQMKDHAVVPTPEEISESMPTRELGQDVSSKGIDYGGGQSNPFHYPEE